MVTSIRYYGEPVFIDPDDMTNEEWAFLCRILGFEGDDPSKYVRFTIESFEACVKGEKRD